MRSKFLPFLIVVVFVCSQIQTGAWARAGASTKRPSLKSQVPLQDLSIVPDPTEIFDRAVQQYQAGNLDQASGLFQQVLKIDPSNADAHFNLGAIWEWRKDFKKALRHYKSASHLKPSDAEIKQAVVSLELKIQNQAIEEIETAKARHAEELGLHGHKAKEAFSAKNYELAVFHLNHLVHAFPTDAKVQFALGQSLRATKNYDWAAYRLKMAIYLDSDNELYRKTLTELDNEIEEMKDKAYAGFAELALARVKPLSFTEAAETGMGL